MWVWTCISPLMGAGFTRILYKYAFRYKFLLMTIMDSRTILYAAISVFAVGFAAFMLYGRAGGSGAGFKSNATYVTTAVTPSHAGRPSSVLFSSTPYLQYAYLISGGNLSQEAKAALTGFNMTSDFLSNGTEEIRIAIQGSGQNQTIMLDPGYKLYIIETTFSDDSYGFDASLGDDGLVMVNQTGYVV